jgi:hypothetical protein
LIQCTLCALVLIPCAAYEGTDFLSNDGFSNISGILQVKHDNCKNTQQIKINSRIQQGVSVTDKAIPGMLFSWHSVTAVMSITERSLEITSL